MTAGSERAFQWSFKSLAEKNPVVAFRIYEAFFRQGSKTHLGLA
jgi:hypothetical protein